MKDEDKKIDNTTNEEPLEELSKQSEDADSDDVVHFEYNEDGEEDLKKTIKKLRQDLKTVQKEKTEYLNGWQKERASFANYKKEEENRHALFNDLVKEKIINRFLTVADSFNMAFSNKELWEKVDENWRRGIEYIYSQMNNVFEEYGVKEIGVEDELFDPNLHDSVELVQTEKESLDHHIAKVVQKGYKLGTKVLRPARVHVYEYKSPNRD